MKSTITHIKFVKHFLMLFALFLIPLSGVAQEQTLADLIEKGRSAGIEESQMINLQNRAFGRGISEAEFMRIIRPAVSLAEQNLPSEMIFSKAMEGLAKGVPVQQLHPVLQNIQQSTESMVPIVDSWMERGEVNEMLGRSGERFDRGSLRSEMLKAGSRGVSEQSGSPVMVGDILNALTDEGALSTVQPSSLLAGISVISDLPEAAENPDVVRSVVVRAIQSHFSASDIQKLPAAMSVAQRRSQMPAAAVLEGVSEQLQGNSPASRVLQDLFDGNVGGGAPGRTPPGLENRPDRGGPPH